MVVLEVVGEPRAEVIERLGDARDPLAGRVAPDPAVGQLVLGEDRVVGVDHVAGVQEHGGLGLAHRAVAGHAAPLGVAAEALAAGIAGPHHPEAIAARRRKPPRDPGAVAARRLALESHPVAHGLRVGQTVDRHGRGVVARRADHRTGDAPRMVEPLGGVPLDHHARPLVTARPDQRAAGLHIAALDAVCDPRHPRSNDRGARAGECARRQGAEDEASAGHHRDNVAQSFVIFVSGRDASCPARSVPRVSRSRAASAIL